MGAKRLRPIGDWIYLGVLWALSLPMVYITFGIISALKLPSPSDSLLSMMFDIGVLGGGIAWLLLLAMTIAQLTGVRLNKIVPVAGHVCGALGLASVVPLTAGVGLLLLVPGVLLVKAVTPFHMSGALGRGYEGQRAKD